MEPETSLAPVFKVIRRQPDAQAQYIHFTGGFRAAETGDDVWMIEPVLNDGSPCRRGFITKKILIKLAHTCGFVPIAFQTFSWTDGNYFSHWTPIIPGRTEHSLAASDLWANARSNATSARVSNALRQLEKPSREEIARIADDGDKKEWLARAISLSLKNMDVNVEKICELYNELLVNMLASGIQEDKLVSTGQQNELYAHIHAFFLHLGAARDYLGALIAHRLGLRENKDDFARLLDAIRPDHIPSDRLLQHLLDSDCITTVAPSKVEPSGWLKKASETRKQFVHKRPYGSRYLERFGAIKKADERLEIYRYVQKVELDGTSHNDILDVIVSIYRNFTKLFFELAPLSGMDISIRTITDKDIVTIAKIER